MSLDVAVVDGSLYQARDHDCIGVQAQPWRLETVFLGWAQIGGTVWYAAPCDTRSAALEQAQKLYAAHAHV